MYFNKFPLVRYDNYFIRNFLIRVVNDFKIKRDYLLFHTHTITDTERADTLAYSYYKHPMYAWVIYTINNLSPEDWPLTADEFEEMMEHKYGDTKNKVAFHVDENGNPVQQIIARQFETEDDETISYYNDGEGYGALVNNFLISQTLTPKTWYEYEFELNEAKRSIQILDRKYLGEFVMDFEKRVNGAVQ